ncbi:MAG: phage tail protein, partial [Lactococcus lactis]
MEIVVHDNILKTVAVINNDIPMLPSFFNDNWHRYKDQGAETFIFTVNKFINGQLQDYCRFLNEQAYISFTYDGIDHLFGVENVQESDYQITLTCSSLNLELRNEQANALVNTSSHNIQWYIDQMELISNAQITIGTNEVSSLTRTINYDGQESKLARLISVIGNFNAEFEFITHLNDDGTLDSIILNIYRANDGVNIQGVGTNRNDVSLNFGKNISGITRTGDTTNLFNATKITGSDDLNWNSSEFSYVNSDGVEEFYKRKNDDTAFAPLSLNLFKSQIKSNNGDKWIRKDFQTEYTNVNDMWGYCVSQFKQFAYPTVTYEVLANSSLVLESVGNDRPLSIGDTINIQDDNFMDSDGNVGLLLSARVSEMEISFSNPTLNKITFSNFKKQQSEASTDIQAIVNQLVDAATPYRAELTTTNGTQFKNGTGSTTLSAHIFKGSATTETVADSYEWSKDGTVVAPTQTIIVDASGVTDKAVYSFKATVAGKVVASQSVTITNVDDGTDGKTPYFHTAWSYSADGTNGFTTVYPNLNLLTDSKDFKNKNVAEPLATTSITSPGSTIVKDGNDSYLKFIRVSNQNQDWFRAYMIRGSSVSPNFPNVDVKPNSQYTFSVWLKGTGAHTIFAYDKWTNVNPTTLTVNLTDTWTKYVLTVNTTTIIPTQGAQFFIRSGIVGSEINLKYPKVEPGSIATPHMLSASEVTTADWPSYIGQYSDFTQADSTNPSAYTWSLIRGNDGKDGATGKDGRAGKDGTGIKTTVITYAISTSGTDKPVTGWTSQVPTLVKGQYLWTKTVWTYTDNSSETGYSVSYIAKDGNNGNDGIAGKDGVGLINTTLRYAKSKDGVN